MLSAPLVHGAYRGGPSHLPGFSLVCDFKRGLHRLGAGRGRMVTDFLQLPGASYARSGADLIFEALGRLWSFPANVMPVVPGYGLECPEGTTNVCTNHNFTSSSLTGLTPSVPGGGEPATVSRVARADLPPAVLAALNAKDPSGLVTHLTRVQSNGTSSSQGCVCLGDVGVLTASTLSIYAFVVSGGASVVLDANFSALGQTPLLSNFERTWLTVTPDTTARRLRTRNLSGVNPAEWYFFGNQFEPKAHASPVVPVAGAQASRGDPIARITNLGDLLVRPFTLIGLAKGGVADGVTRTMLQVDNGFNTSADRFQLSRTVGNGLTLFNGGGDNLGMGAGAHAGVVNARMAGQIRSDGLDLTANGISSSSPTTTLADRNRLSIGSSGAGTTAWRGAVEFAGIISRLTTQAEREALTA